MTRFSSPVVNRVALVTLGELKEFTRGEPNTPSFSAPVVNQTPVTMGELLLISWGGGRVEKENSLVSHGRYVAFQMAEVAIPRNLVAAILRLIAPPAAVSA